MKKFKVIKNKICRMCNSKNFWEVINLGKHPLVNSLVEKKDINKEDPVFPIVVRQCKKCKLVQLTNIIDANEIYKNVDYLYFSSDMPGLDKYFKPYAKDLEKRFLRKKDFIVEIGCNDGIMLNFFKNKYKVLGVDPATNVVLRTLRKNIPSVPLFFSADLSKKIKNEWGSAKLIYGNNCIAHLDGLRDLMQGVKNLLTDDGIFVLECNYWGGMVKNTNYSLIYHDHFSYFSILVWKTFSKKYNMYPFDAVVTPAQGGSLRLFLSKKKRKITPRYKKLLDEEIKSNLNSYDKSMSYKKNVINQSRELQTIVKELKSTGKKIAGYGAAAKGMTILKCSNIGKKLEYFVDDSPAKQGFFSPVDHVPIISRKEAQKKLPDYFIILAPNYSDVIIKKEKDFISRGGKFIVPKNGIHIYP
tara:strand:+ start:794 stop:2035 length:1242 start_codon:yes stop_codon:yes gene_type:complete